jgi:hypothetical protein
MTRVNVDDVAFMDRRFKLLGGRLGITWQEALGRCLPVWAFAYAKRTAILKAGDIDAVAERQGFAAAMADPDVDLAAEDEGGLYLRGVTDRIDFLLIQDAKRDKARRAKMDAAGVAVPRRRPPGPSPGTAPQVGPYSPDLDLDPDLDVPLVADQQGTFGLTIQPGPPSAPEPAAPGRRRRLPEDWMPDRSKANLAAEDRARARGVDIDEELAKFRDWTKGSAAKKDDWEATWRNWTRNARPMLTNRVNGSSSRDPEQPRKIPTLA